MFNFEDELIIEPGVSWLIWIQLLLMVLIFALCCLSFLASDSSKTSGSDNKSAPSTASSSTATAQDITIDRNQSRNAQVDNEQSIQGEIETSTSTRIALVREGTVLGGEGSQETKLYLHPCTYFRLAKSAFLRCLGLDSSTENSVSERRQRKSKES